LRTGIQNFLAYTKNLVLTSSYQGREEGGLPMAKRVVPRPTEAELEILGVLWRRGGSTVREVHEELARGRPLGYTTVLKLLQIMAEKGLVRRDESERAHVYAASTPAEQTQRQILGDLLERAFGGSAERLVQQALSSRKASPEEIARIREFLDELERGRK
jgi:BlaI family penicillinase repressor